MRKLVRSHKRKSLLLLASVLTGAEAIVGSGVQLPFADIVPWWLRMVVIGGVIGGAYLVREQVGDDEQR